MNHDTTKHRAGLVLSKDAFGKLLAFIEDPQMANDQLRSAIDELLMSPQGQCEIPEKFLDNCP